MQYVNSWVVRQPDGLLAFFSGEEACFVAKDLTHGEAFLLLRGIFGDVDAREAVRQGAYDRNPSTQCGVGNGLARWRDAIALIREEHGDAEALRCARSEPTTRGAEAD
jgi:hypothetical protein